MKAFVVALCLISAVYGRPSEVNSMIRPTIQEAPISSMIRPTPVQNMIPSLDIPKPDEHNAVVVSGDSSPLVQIIINLVDKTKKEAELPIVVEPDCETPSVPAVEEPIPVMPALPPLVEQPIGVMPALPPIVEDKPIFGTFPGTDDQTSPIEIKPIGPGSLLRPALPETPNVSFIRPAIPADIIY